MSSVGIGETNIAVTLVYNYGTVIVVYVKQSVFIGYFLSLLNKIGDISITLEPKVLKETN